MPPLIYGTVIILGLCIMALSFLFGDDSNFNIALQSLSSSSCGGRTNTKSNRGHKMYRGHPPVSPNPSRVAPQI